MLNIELLRTVRETLVRAKENRTWDQSMWAAVERGKSAPESPESPISCGTSMCVAGWTCFLSGKEIDWRGAERDGGYLVASELTDGTPIEQEAQKLLGLNDYQVSDIFYCMDETEALRRIDNLLTDGDTGTGRGQ